MWGQIAGAVVGGLFANKRASNDRRAKQQQIDAQMAGFNQYAPYVDSALLGSQGALNNVLAQGAYGGPTYAAPSADYTSMLQNQLSQGSTMGGLGAQIATNNANFGQNAQNLYGQALANAGNIGGYQNRFNDNITNQGNLVSNYNQLATDAGGFGNYANNIATNAGTVGDTNQRFMTAAENIGALANTAGGYEQTFNNFGTQFGGLADRAGQIGRTGSRQINRAGNQLQDLVGQASDDRLGAATSYAMQNASPLVDAMLRDERRSLGMSQASNNQSASGTGNVNSSRAGVAEAMMNDRFLDRQADVKADVTNQLRNQALNQMNTQFGQQQSALNSLIGARQARQGAALAGLGAEGQNIGLAANMAGQASGALNNQANLIGLQSGQIQAANSATGQQAALTGQAANQLSNQLNAQSGAYNNMANAYNNQAAAAQGAVGNIGAQNAALNAAGGFNNNIQSAFGTGLNAMNSGFGMGNRAGGALQAQQQAALNDAQNQYNAQRDFEMQQYQNYMSGILGRAPNSPSNVQANMVNPQSAALGGMFQGYGLMGGNLPFGFGGF